jgi:uncharacterized membrane protein
VGAAIVLGHNLLSPVDQLHFGALEPLWNLLHERGSFALGSRKVFVSYPLLPWIGVIALGFGLGTWLHAPRPERARRLIRTGVLLCAAFVLLRAANFYGDPHPWSVQPRAGFTLLSFLNCEKYPPSLSFLLMTLGPALLALERFEHWRGALSDVVATFGRVPLFFYVTHLYLLRFTAAPLALARFGPVALTPPPGPAGSPEYPLWGAYLAWLLALALLYPACRWFARKKATSRAWWMSYL